MAQQKGILPVQGTVGNITFYKSGDGYGMKTKSAISKKRMATDPAFERTRENGAEFGRAAGSGKTLRMAFGPLVKNASDGRMISRLTRDMMKVIKSDTVNARGKRRVVAGEPELLSGFEFNINGLLSSTLKVPFEASIDRVTGELKIEVPAFIPKDLLAAPVGSTHYRLQSAGAEVDFDNKKYRVAVNGTAPKPWDNQATAAVTLTNTVTVNSTLPLFLVLGVDFFQETNGNLYPLNNGAFNALALVKVSGN